jgi:tRNA threonylcarbamoyladenosine biosynthesis protein TsaE
VTLPADAVVVASDDPATTRALAARLARVAEPGDLLCLIGELGAGKTQFAKGFGAGLGVTDVVNSPTFVLMTEYEGRLPLFHLDLYRLADAADALGGGLLDERQREGVTLVEWAERLGDAMPEARLDVRIDGTGDEPRTIRLEAGDARHRRYLAAAVAAETAA